MSIKSRSICRASRILFQLLESTKASRPRILAGSHVSPHATSLIRDRSHAQGGLFDAFPVSQECLRSPTSDLRRPTAIRNNIPQFFPFMNSFHYSLPATPARSSAGLTSASLALHAGTCGAAFSTSTSMSNSTSGSSGGSKASTGVAGKSIEGKDSEAIATTPQTSQPESAAGTTERAGTGDKKEVGGGQGDGGGGYSERERPSSDQQTALAFFAGLTAAALVAWEVLERRQASKRGRKGKEEEDEEDED